MSISDLSAHRPGSSAARPVGVLAEMVTRLRDLDATWWTSQPDDDLIAIVEQVQAIKATLGAVEAGAVAEADARDLAQHNLDTELPPESHGAPARLMITIGLETLKQGLADTAVTGITRLGVTGVGTELSVTTIRRLACDAEVVPAVLGSRGEPLDVGRTKRLVTLVICVALVIRDRHCAFPGCDRPPLMCHAHHILHRLFGGETKLENLVLLCGHHHRVIHDSPWKVRISQHVTDRNSCHHRSRARKTPGFDNENDENNGRPVSRDRTRCPPDPASR